VGGGGGHLDGDGQQEEDEGGHGVLQVGTRMLLNYLGSKDELIVAIISEASTLGLFGEEPYASAVAESNARWMAAVRDHLVASGVPGHRVEAVAPLVDAAFMGFELDLPLDEEEAAAGVEALAEAIELLSRS
jgi:AcrR family transcriptional regulator